MRVLVCGDRNWQDRKKIEKELRKAKRNAVDSPLVVCSGGARGADTFAAEYCIQEGIPFFECVAQWGRYGRRAGPMRNNWMLKYFQPELVLAFHSNLDESVGTAHMVARAQAKGIPVIVIQ